MRLVGCRPRRTRRAGPIARALGEGEGMADPGPGITTRSPLVLVESVSLRHGVVHERDCGDVLLREVGSVPSERVVHEVRPGWEAFRRPRHRLFLARLVAGCKRVKARQIVTTMYPWCAGTYATQGARTSAVHASSWSSTARLNASSVISGPISSGGGPTIVSPRVHTLRQLSIQSAPTSLMWVVRRG